MWGVVVEYQLPRATRGKDLKSVLYLADEGCKDGEVLSVNFFKAHPKVHYLLHKCLGREVASKVHYLLHKCLGRDE